MTLCITVLNRAWQDISGLTSSNVSSATISSMTKTGTSKASSSKAAALATAHLPTQELSQRGKNVLLLTVKASPHSLSFQFRQGVPDSSCPLMVSSLSYTTYTFCHILKHKTWLSPSNYMPFVSTEMESQSHTAQEDISYWFLSPELTWTLEEVSSKNIVLPWCQLHLI